MPSLSQIQKFIKHNSKDASDDQSSYHFKRSVSHPLFEAHYRFLSLQNAFDIMFESIDIMCMFSCFISQVHRIIRNQEHEHERHGEHHTI